MTSGIQTGEALITAATQSMDRAADYLFGLQIRRGLLVGELTADTTLESDYILLQIWLHPPENGVWNPPSRSRDR